MRTQSKKVLYQIVLIYANGMTRRIPVKAATREVAEDRALKRNPNAQGVKRDADIPDHSPETP